MSDSPQTISYLAQVIRERDEARAEVEALKYPRAYIPPGEERSLALSAIMISQAETEIRALRAEIEMLRGVGCREAKDGEPESGPCGVCLKCAEERGAKWRDLLARVERERQARWDAESRLETRWALRRELEQLLGIGGKPASDDQFAAGVAAVRALIADAAAARIECASWRAQHEEAEDAHAKADVDVVRLEAALAAAVKRAEEAEARAEKAEEVRETRLGDCSHGVHGPWCREWKRMADRAARAEADAEQAIHNEAFNERMKIVAWVRARIAHLSLDSRTTMQALDALREVAGEIERGEHER